MQIYLILVFVGVLSIFAYKNSIKKDSPDYSIVSISKTDTSKGEEYYVRAMTCLNQYIGSPKKALIDSMNYFLDLSIAQSYPDAFAIKGCFLLFGDYLPLDTVKGIALIKQGAKLGSGTANFNLGVYHFCNGNTSVAETYFIYADSLGVEIALFELYYCFRNGRPHKEIIGSIAGSELKNEEKAFHYLKLSVEKGYIEAKISIMKYYSTNNMIPEFQCTVIDLLNDPNLANGLGLRDNVEIFLYQKYGVHWNDTISTFECNL